MSENKLKNIGPDIGQLSKQFSFNEKVQIEASQNTGASLGSKPGQINGPINKALNRVTNKQKSAMELGANLASKLEDAGSVRKNSREIITNSVNRSVNNRLPIYRKNSRGENLEFTKSRQPGIKRSVSQIMKRNRGDVTGLVLEQLGFMDLSFDGLRFPLDLEGDEGAITYLSLAFQKYNRADAMQPGTMSGATFIKLPLPENFSFNYGIKLQESDTGIYGDLIRTQTGQEAFQQLGDNMSLSGTIKTITDGIKNATTAEASRFTSEIAKRAAFASLNSTDPIVGGLASQAKGGIPNPHPSIFFKGMDLREFVWNWKMVPRNKDESRAITAIIAALREFVVPRVNGTFLDYPYMVTPDVVGGDKNLYGTFRKSMVKSMTVNYSAEGTSAFFVDGSPVSINLNMTLSELENYREENRRYTDSDREATADTDEFLAEQARANNEGDGDG